MNNIEPHYSRYCRNQLLKLEEPRIMGILNATPDSFYAESRIQKEQVIEKARKHIQAGASILDIGGQTSKHGSKPITDSEEMDRVLPLLEILVKEFPDILISIDTFYASVARETLKTGAHIINDIYAGKMDPGLWQVVKDFKAGYIFMHMKGIPETMQVNPSYENAPLEIFDFLNQTKAELYNFGITQIIADPGFGFGKTLEHNFELLRNLNLFKQLDLPILCGISRKSMVCKALGVSPEEALNGTTALHMLCLLQGAHIIRVHDPLQASECIRLWKYYQRNFVPDAIETKAGSL